MTCRQRAFGMAVDCMSIGMWIRTIGTIVVAVLPVAAVAGDSRGIPGEQVVGQAAPLECPASDPAVDPATRVEELLEEVREARLLISGRASDQHYRQALSGLDCAVRLTPDDPRIFYERARTHQWARQFDLAIKDYDRALARQTNDVDTWIGRGLALLGLERLDDALADFDRAIEIDPSRADGYFARSTGLMRERRYKEAIPDLDRAISLRPNESNMHHDRAWARWAIGDLKGAVDDFTLVLSNFPNDIEVRYSRAVVNKMRGEPEKALADYEAILRIAPDETRAKERLKRLREQLKRTKRL